MTHPEAIYLHGGESYYVASLDLEKKVAVLNQFWGDYYTDPVKDIQIEKLSELRQRQSGTATVHQGEIMVNSQVVGYRRVRWDTREIVDVHDMLMPVNTLRTTAYWIQFSEEMIDGLRSENHWSNDPNNYGPTWNAIRMLVKRRDQFRCQLCGAPESGEKPLHVHHKIPFRTFAQPEQANRIDNLISLCPACHREAEKNVKMKSGLAGLQYVLHHLAPLELMCDMGDLESNHDAKAAWAEEQPSIILYELIPAGIGFADQLYEGHERLMAEAYDLVCGCSCNDGCPSCVGPAGENGSGGKMETLALLRLLTKNVQFETERESIS
jgi:DEAD/DEAH box helicase domain-containing protein